MDQFCHPPEKGETLVEVVVCWFVESEKTRGNKDQELNVNKVGINSFECTH